MEKHKLDDRFGKEYAGEYVFQPISWGRLMKITQRYTKRIGRKSIVDSLAVSAHLINETLVKRPKAVTLEKLLSQQLPDKGGLPIGLGNWLSDIVNRLTSPDEEDQKK